ncbi:hypothetical protein F4808DRAFT_410583 [Astrocystis sublimbata]|nr:hypothetical protein F4808DRAFT_410583 [Astrocystis sublimbata]
MAAGLDELIESLLTEIAFSGVRGCSVSSLLTAIGAFYKSSSAGDEGVNPGLARTPDAPEGSIEPQQGSESEGYDLAVASKVWKWLADRSDVSIGVDRICNHLSLEQVLVLPEEEESPRAAAESSETTKAPSRSKLDPRISKNRASEWRPRLFVSEERQWRTITGHGPDLKRVPLFEWRALVDIASVKETGILQGDLVRLTGQDKRSLPTRTDALARKGYVIKQPIVLRGGKSSKLWLAQFAEHAKEHQEQEGLDYDQLDLSKMALTCDLQPVPFCGKWNRDTIDYLALAQAFVAIVKAWNLIRYCDARAKLGVEERVRQMRALAKTCRWLTNIGALSFIGAKFPGSNRLFKDCVKFIRDPTPAEWSHFRATPKTRMVVPSGRIGKRGEASRAVHASQPSEVTLSKATGKKLRVKKPRSEPVSYGTIIPLPWKPQKPVPNTAFEIIKRAGSKGTSNAAICRQTLGYNYRRLTAAMTGSISMPTNSQPPHLKHLSSASQLSRIGKTMTYTFYANSEIAGNGTSEQQLDDRQSQISNGLPASGSGQDIVLFPQPDLRRFASNPSASLTELTRPKSSSQMVSRKLKRRRSIDEDQDDHPPVKLPRRLGRPPTKQPANVKSPIPEEDDTVLSEPGDATIVAPEPIQAHALQQLPPETIQPVLRPPGVYRGVPNSLDPDPKKKGRKRRSLVLIFRSDRLKDPSFLGLGPATTSNDNATTASRDLATDDTLMDAEPLVPQSTGTSTPAIATPKVTSERLHTQSKTPKSGNKGLFRCTKCGNTWKNSNGLDYHLTKSRTVCNPDFVAPSSELITQRRRKSTQPQVLERLSGRLPATAEKATPRLNPQEQVQYRIDGGTPSRLSPSQSTSSSPRKITPPLSHIRDTPRSRKIHSSIVLKELEVFDATNHRSLQHQRSQGTSREMITGDTNDSAPVAQPSSINRHISSNARLSTKDSNQSRQADIDSQFQRHECQDNLPKDTNQTVSSSIDPTFSTLDKNSINGQSKVSDEGLSVTTPAGRSALRKPLPLKKPVSSSSSPGLDQSTNIAALASQPSILDNSIPQQPTNKALAAFARPTRPKASFGVRRRARTIQIINYLFAQNDGVFPGLRSLFMGVISVWVKEFTDLAPPDRRTCQNVVNQMERDGSLKQLHFCFFDEQAKMQECVVLAKAEKNSAKAVDLTGDPRVLAVKGKIREMFPESYVPAAFSLSPEEVKLFDGLVTQGREQNLPRNLKTPKSLKRVQDIEVLRYESSVMGGIPIHKGNAKRHADDEQIETPPPKIARIDVDPPISLDRNRKPRKRPDMHEVWDSGKLAVYIWSQRKKPGAMWDKHPSCLQDPVTGAWSWSPDTDSSQLGTITKILSSTKSARHIDASMKRKGRRRTADIDILSGSNRNDQNSNQSSREVRRNAGYVLTAEEDDYESLIDPALKSCTTIPFAANGRASDEDTEMYDDSSEDSGDELAASNDLVARLPVSGTTHDDKDGSWPITQKSPYEPRDETTCAINKLPQSAIQLSVEALLRRLHDISNKSYRVKTFNKRTDPAYGRYLRHLKTIRKWEQSTDGFQAVTHGTVTPEQPFISYTVDERKAKPKPIRLEWLAYNQFSAGNIPDEVKNATRDDENYGLSYLIKESRKIKDVQRRTKKSEHRTTGRRTTSDNRSKLKPASRKPNKQTRRTAPPKAMMLPEESEGFFEYKTRDLTIIPKQPRGRYNKPVHDDRMGSKREDELIAACIVLRTLLGGLDRNLDLGLLLKHFPGMSLSAIRKLWPKVSRERKSYVQALTTKFQSEFLAAYESGKLPPLDYDNIENYDWPRVVVWASQLETLEEVDLPRSREALYHQDMVEETATEGDNWRDIWFATTSTYNRIEAVASETMSIPLPPKVRHDRVVLDRARTWVRSICCTSLKGVNVNDKLVPKLLELGNGAADETNKILEKAVAELNKEKVITKTKGKSIGGNFRIHGMFSKQLEKLSSTPKFRQAIAFKIQLDEAFREIEEFIIPYASDDGTVMAVLNLQAQGRIRVDAPDLPDIPFGFEPGNYEGRTFPKSYYHFKVRLVPTEAYLYNEDMTLLKQAAAMETPCEGPDGKIPIWVDFLGKVNTSRWADYVSMVAITLAIKGPVNLKMCVTLLRPMIEEFEVRLIVDWLDQLGLIHRAVEDCGVTAAEWWWLVAGHIVRASDTSREKGNGFQIAA